MKAIYYLCSKSARLRKVIMRVFLWKSNQKKVVIIPIDLYDEIGKKEIKKLIKQHQKGYVFYNEHLIEIV